jgi:hypothetical protein
MKSDAGGGLVRASTALDSGYEAESRLLSTLENTDESTRGKLLRALVRAGFRIGNSSATQVGNAIQKGGEHGT